MLLGKTDVDDIMTCKISEKRAFSVDWNSSATENGHDDKSENEGPDGKNK